MTHVFTDVYQAEVKHEFALLSSFQSQSLTNKAVVLLFYNRKGRENRQIERQRQQKQQRRQRQRQKQRNVKAIHNRDRDIDIRDNKDNKSRGRDIPDRNNRDSIGRSRGRDRNNRDNRARDKETGRETKTEAESRMLDSSSSMYNDDGRYHHIPGTGRQLHVSNGIFTLLSYANNHIPFATGTNSIFLTHLKILCDLT